MAHQNKNNSMFASHLKIDSLSFSVLTKDQLRRLCMTKIYTPLTFDALGHPLPGSIYDKTLGPLTEKSGPCGSCQRNFYSCPGHFGYIELPLPVVNPVFHKIIGIILRVTCLSCFKIQIPDHIKHSLAIQNNLLNCGLVIEAMEIETCINELIDTYESYDNIPEAELAVVKKYEMLAVHTAAELAGKYVLNKNTEMLRNQFINTTLRNVKGGRKTCLFCHKPMAKLQTIRNKVVLTQRVVTGGGDTNRSRGDDDNHYSSVMSSSRIRAVESKYITPEESKRYMRNLWHEEKEFMLQIVSVLHDNINDKYPTDIFYFDIIPVVPPIVRPVSMVAGRISEHSQSQMYRNILNNTILLRSIIHIVQTKGDVDSLGSDEAKGQYNFAHGATPIEKLNNAWEALQYSVDGLLDRDAVGSRDGQGLKQILEKKAGIIRMHMMGKRVNYSARSVITPDPNLNIDEIGVPEAFAKHLTYPVPVTTWNVEELRRMVMNGPNIHPGAVMVEFEDGTIKRIHPSDTVQQESILKRLLTPGDKGKGFKGLKKVHRHLRNGDVLLMNRQPTLHKPSIMAHTARILKGEKTFRLHYANCKAYNADFDGDEMNAHFPQDEVARSEGYNLANVSNQYLVPKDGTPLSGLIQDHMISGVRMSLRGRFFNKFDYQQLIYQGLSFKTGRIILLPPGIIKPCMLWSGKQILSTIIINVIPDGQELINLTATSKISAKAWEVEKPRQWKAGGTPLKSANDMSEAEVIIRNGELLTGVLDKTHYGATPYGLVHCIYELYGGTYATRLLSALTKLFTRFLQQEGFTLGVQDILTLPAADKERQRIIKKCRKIGRPVITQALDLAADSSLNEIVEAIDLATVNNPKLRSIIDRQYKSALDNVTNDINKVCLPDGLISKFPQNNLQLMVQSGAKGSTVNTMQISCLLGQIELEGKRPPLMINGKSLPSFPIDEYAPRAGGFIDGRFMTGIQPQEFFFHCMAGREGLIDTAVKTSRSGYLQRCLIKHLEGLTVGYDLTVRDSDKCVIQFLYGEDGMDISKVQFLNDKQMQFLADNAKALHNRKLIKSLKNSSGQTELQAHYDKLNEWHEKHGQQSDIARKSPFTLFSQVIKAKTTKKMSTKKVRRIWNDLEHGIREKLQKQCDPCPSPVNSLFQSDHHYGSINEHLEKLMRTFRTTSPMATKRKYQERFEDMFKLKAMQSLCAPGEPVGIIAAQSIGEPSTQMTLNTFHFAGRGEMNVTLGIPRLREILMMASKNIKTPSMEIPFLTALNNDDEDDIEVAAENLRRKLTRVVVANVLEQIDVDVVLEVKPRRQYKYKVRFQFLPMKLYQADYIVRPKFILKHMAKKFFGEMFTAIRKYSKINSNFVSMDEEKDNKRASRKNDSDNDEDNDAFRDEPEEPQPQSDDNDDDDNNNSSADEEDAKTTNKHQQVHEDDDQDEEYKHAVSEDDDDDVNNDSKNKMATNENDQNGVEDDTVVHSYNFVERYVYDQKKYLWCEITFALPLNYKKLDLTAILRDVATKSVLWQIPNINRAITYMKDDRLMLRTDGINILEMFKYHKLLDLNRLYCNDIHKMADTYGIEAAMKIIVKEVKDVFNVYGIKVDPRHLSLIADYMTFNGTFEPLSRKGMESSASPLQQITFESSLTFLKAAAIRGKRDQLSNPSSCLIVGKPSEVGTGCFSVLPKIPRF